MARKKGVKAHVPPQYRQLTPDPAKVAQILARRQVVEAQEKIGRRVRRVRNQRGMSQAELGAAIGVRHSQISYYERGLIKMRPDRLASLADVLRVRVEYFTK